MTVELGRLVVLSFGCLLCSSDSRARQVSCIVYLLSPVF